MQLGWPATRRRQWRCALGPDAASSWPPTPSSPAAAASCPRPRSSGEAEPAWRCCRAGAIACYGGVCVLAPDGRRAARASCTTMVRVQAPERAARSTPTSRAANGGARPAATPSRAGPRPSSPRSTAPTPTSSACRWSRRWRCCAAWAGDGRERPGSCSRRPASASGPPCWSTTGWSRSATAIATIRGVTERCSSAASPPSTPKLNAAFLDCGLPRPALLVAKDARAAAGIAERLPIRQLVQRGPAADRPGRARGRRRQGCAGHQRREAVRLCARLQPARPAVERGRSNGAAPGRGAARARPGAVSRRPVRAAPPRGDAADDGAARGVRAAGRRWRRLQGAAAGRGRPGRLPEPESPLERLLRGLVELAPSAIEVADRACCVELERLLASQAPTCRRWTLGRLSPDEPPSRRPGSTRRWSWRWARRCRCRRGGRLLIEPTAACVAIDVDGGGRAPLDVDLEAASEIARQVRLRNLGGTIIVDFVDLPSRPERQRLEEALRKAFRARPGAARDPRRCRRSASSQISRARRGAAAGQPCSWRAAPAAAAAALGPRRVPTRSSCLAALRQAQGDVTGGSG